MSDDLRAVAVVARCGLIDLAAWPGVATQLLVLGHGGAALAELAGAGRDATWSELEPLVASALSEIDLPELPPVEALGVALGLVEDQLDRWEMLGRVAQVLPVGVGPLEVENSAHAHQCPQCRDLDDPRVGELLRSGTPVQLDPGLRGALIAAL